MPVDRVIEAINKKIEDASPAAEPDAPARGIRFFNKKQTGLKEGLP